MMPISKELGSIGVDWHTSWSALLLPSVKAHTRTSADAAVFRADSDGPASCEAGINVNRQGLARV